MLNRSFYRFGYPCPVRAFKDPGPFQIRDGAAFAELNEALRERGWTFDTHICNYPYREGNGDVILGPEHFRFIRPDDLIVQTTRPPLHDHLTDNRKQIPRSLSHLEKAIFAEMDSFFEFLCREQVRLAPALLDRVSPDTPGRFHFRQTHDARLSKIGSRDPQKRDTIMKPTAYWSLGFFIHLPAIRDYGCRFIASFGMGGFETLVWNRLIRMNHGDWLDQPRFVMAEIDLNHLPERPLTLRFAHDVPVRMLIDLPL